MAGETFIWRCPTCAKPYKIKVGKRPPVQCPTCVDEKRIEEARQFDEFASSVAAHSSPDADAPTYDVASEEQVIPPTPTGPTFVEFMPVKIKKRRKLGRWVVAASVAMVFGAIGVVLMMKPARVDAPPPQPPRPKPTKWTDLTLDEQEGLKKLAYTMTRKLIDETLKAPSTAQWSAEYSVTPSENNTGVGFDVKSHVDAQNPNGVFLRLKFSGTTQYSFATDKMKMQYVTSNGEVVWADPELRAAVVLFQRMMRQHEEADKKPRQWEVVMKVQGDGKSGEAVTNAFTCAAPNWRVAINCDHPIKVVAIDNDGAEHVIVQSEGRPGIVKTTLLDGVFKLRVICLDRWAITVAYPEY